MSYLSFSSSGLLFVVRRKGVSTFSSSISSFIILFMNNQVFWKNKTVEFFDVQHFLPISLEHLSFLSKINGIWILQHPLKVYADLKNVEL